MLIDKNYLMELNITSRKHFKNLIKCNIIFTDVNNLYNFLKKNWNSIEDWWESDPTKFSVKTFVKYNAISSEHPIKIISSKINNII